MTTHGRGFTPTRRNLLLGTSAALLAPGPLPTPEYQELARGTVRDDARRGRGIANVLVSNGREVVATDRDGRWALRIMPGDFIFVVKPSGWKVTTRAGNRGYWFHLHDPLGTPGHFASRFTGVAPTGALPASIDFVLSRSNEPNGFDVAMVADTQPGNMREIGYVRDSLLAPIAEHRTAFAIHHGDVMGDDLSLFPIYRKLIGETGIDWHHCPGNHDMNLDSGDPRLAFETWRREVGPLHYAFQYGGATFLILNNVDAVTGQNARAAERGYVGRMGDAQLRFVRNVLRHVPHEQLVVVSMHVPLVSYEDPTHPSDNTTNAAELLALLSRRPSTVSFSGHSHTTEHHYLGASHGFLGAQPHHHHVLTAACGSWWSGPADSTGVPHSVSRDGTPRGFHILSVDGSRYTTNFVPTADVEGVQTMRVMAEPEVNLSGQAKRRRLLVNVFDGCPSTKVVMQMCDSGCDPVVMKHSIEVDPYVSSFLSSHAATSKPWASASPTSHMWAADLPVALPPGNHTVRVTARHASGATHAIQTVISIKAV